MDRLIESSLRKVNNVPDAFSRYLMNKISWNSRLIGIKGARGVGKTTLMLQYLKRNLPIDKGLYVSLDNIWFGENSVVSLADSFSKKGGSHLFLDEVHKYPDWSRQIKNIYDDYPDLSIVFSGSSMLEILNARADLSRRAITYSMKGLSFREFINLQKDLNLLSFSLSELLDNHVSIATEILKSVKPFQYFDKYLLLGHYPFFNEGEQLYPERLEEVVKLIIEIELPLLRGIDPSYVPKIRQLLQVLAQSVPFIPNLVKLSERIGINRNTLVQYLNYLDEAGLTKNIYKNAFGITKLQKPEKIYLENTNFMYAFKNTIPEKGNLRETFFVNQLSEGYQINYAEKGDFFVNDKYTFEIGGKSKTSKQISVIPNSYVIVDDIEVGSQNRIPLWLFGFLY
jgi:predicted AAA+ superfamily ATPase